MPYQTPFDKMNENYKNRTGSFKDRPSAPPSAIDKAIMEAATKAIQKITNAVNPVNNVREVDRRSGQAAAQDQSLMRVRPPKGTFAFGGPDGAGVAPPKGTFAFGGPDGAGVAPEKGTFKPADYSPANYSPTPGYKPTPIGKFGQGISTTAARVIAPLKSLMSPSKEVQDQNEYNRVMGLRTSAEDPNFRGVNNQRARDERAPGMTSGQRSAAGTFNMFPEANSNNQPAGIDPRAVWNDINTGLKSDTPILGEWLRPTAGPMPPTGYQTGPRQASGTDQTSIMRHGPQGDRTAAAANSTGDPTALPKPGTAIGNPARAPRTPTGNRYMQLLEAGPDAQRKAIDKADLIHMIRGTDQTWGNPKIQGNLGVKEFKSALEAATGIDAPTAGAKYKVDTDAATEAYKSAAEIEKARIAAEKDRFKGIAVDEKLGGQRVDTYNTMTGEVGPQVSQPLPPGPGNEESPETFWKRLLAGQVTNEEAEAYNRKATQAQRKRIAELGAKKK